MPPAGWESDTRFGPASEADETVTMQEVADILKVSRAAIYRAMKRSNEAATLKDLRKAEKAAKTAADDET